MSCQHVPCYRPTMLKQSMLSSFGNWATKPVFQHVNHTCQNIKSWTFLLEYTHFYGSVLAIKGFVLCWDCKKMYLVKLAVPWIPYFFLSYCHIFSTVPWKHTTTNYKKCEVCANFCEKLYNMSQSTDKNVIKISIHIYQFTSKQSYTTVDIFISKSTLVSQWEFSADTT